MATNKKTKSDVQIRMRIKALEETIGGTIIQTMRDDMYIVRLQAKKNAAKLVGAVKGEAAADQLANTLVPKMSRAFRRPGVNRQSVFQSITGKEVYAYSLDPQDPTKIIKEDQAGKQTIGRMASDGTFRAARSKAA